MKDQEEKFQTQIADNVKTFDKQITDNVKAFETQVAQLEAKFQAQLTDNVEKLDTQITQLNGSFQFIRKELVITDSQHFLPPIPPLSKRRNRGKKMLGVPNGNVAVSYPSQKPQKSMSAPL